MTRMENKDRQSTLDGSRRTAAIRARTRRTGRGIRSISSKNDRTPITTPRRLECRIVDGVAVARFCDRWPDDASVGLVSKELRNLLSDDSVRHVVIDFEGTEFFEANLRSVLVRTARELAKRDGRLVLSSLPRAMRDHPTIVMFGRELMTIVEGQDEAIRVIG
jgi:anti-anti-sigma regulatory factor